MTERIDGYLRFPVKLFEVRDAGTFIPIIATRLLVRDPNHRAPGFLMEVDSDAEEYLLGRTGYGRESIHGLPDHPPYVLVARLVGSSMCSYDPYDWGNRTLTTAHQYIIDHWNELQSGQVIDVEFILGERTEPKKSERLDYPL